MRARREQRHDQLDGAPARRERLHGTQVSYGLPSAPGRSRSVPPRDRLRRADRSADHHLSRVDGRGRRRHPRSPRARAQGVRGDLHAVSPADARRSRQARPRWREVGVQSAVADRARSGGTVARPRSRRPPARLIGSRALYAGRQGQVPARPKSAVQPDRQRHAGARTQVAAAVRRDRLKGPLRHRAVCRMDRNRAGAHVRARSQKGHAVDRRRCRHLRLGSQAQDRNHRRRRARRSGLHALRRAHDHGLAGGGDAARCGHRRERQTQCGSRAPAAFCRAMPAGRRNRPGGFRRSSIQRATSSADLY